MLRSISAAWSNTAVLSVKRATLARHPAASCMGAPAAATGADICSAQLQLPK